MNAKKCYFPSAAKGTMTGLLFEMPVESGASPRHFVVAPKSLQSHFNKEAGNPCALLVEGDMKAYKFDIEEHGPSSGSGDDTSAIYSYGIKFTNGSPPGL